MGAAGVRTVAFPRLQRLTSHRNHPEQHEQRLIEPLEAFSTKGT